MIMTGGAITNSGSFTVTQNNNEPGSSAPTTAPAASADQAPARRADIGILTVLRQEMAAVVGVLERIPGYTTSQLRGGAQVHEAPYRTEDGVLRIAAMQALEPGTESAASAYRSLRQHFAPPIVLLVGIAGGIRGDLEIGDVVISDEIIYYDPRRVTEEGIRHRGRIQAVAPVLRHRLHAFLLRHGPVVEPGPRERFHLFRGPIGSGNAVITHGRSDLRTWLAEVNEKVLAVETEAAGVAQSFYEEINVDPTLRGWLTIRGISDLADRGKGHSHHDLAAAHAALVMERLLPYLNLVEAGQ
jgi:adenosylhomocysteine nucleosidase